MLITVETLFAFAVAGTTVSLLLEYFPKLNTWFNAKPDNVQRLVILASGLVVVVGSFGLNCVGFLLELPWACDALGFKDALAAFFTFVLTSQGSYLVTPKSPIFAKNV